MIIISIPIMEDLAETTAELISSALSEVYAFSQAMRQELAQARKRMPHVHHIVPANVFSSRNPEIQKHMREMHEMLAKAGINRFVDPMNLMLVSAGTHASLHTDAYIEHVYSYLMMTNGDPEKIYQALFLLRLEIAAQDKYAIGY